MQPAQPATDGEGPLEVSGPAFPPVVKALATALMAGLAVAGWRARDELASASMSAATLAFWAAALAVIALCYGFMLASRTSVTPTHLRQTWLWTKEVALADIKQAKLIQVPGMAWLIVPRLVVRVGNRGIYSFPAGNAPLHRMFARLVREGTLAAKGRKA